MKIKKKMEQCSRCRVWTDSPIKYGWVCFCDACDDPEWGQLAKEDMRSEVSHVDQD